MCVYFFKSKMDGIAIVDCKIVELISISVNRVLWMRVYFFKSKIDGCRIVSIFVNRDVLWICFIFFKSKNSHSGNIQVLFWYLLIFIYFWYYIYIYFNG